MNQNLRMGFRKQSGETVSFRIDRKLKGTLSEEAKRKGITLNTLVSQIFETHTLWGRSADELGLIPFNKEVLRELFRALSAQDVHEIARNTGQTVAREEIMFLFHEISLETILRYIEVRGRHFQAQQHWLKDGVHHFTLQHDLGTNFSVFLKEHLDSMLHTILGRSMDFTDISPNSLSFRIPSPSEPSTRQRADRRPLPLDNHRIEKSQSQALPS